MSRKNKKTNDLIPLVCSFIFLIFTVISLIYIKNLPSVKEANTNADNISSSPACMEELDVSYLCYPEKFFAEYTEDSEGLVEETLSDYFSLTFPEYKNLTLAGSVPENDSFKVISDTKKVYKVYLSTSKDGEKKEIKNISIKTASGKEILNYDGRFYTGSVIYIDKDLDDKIKLFNE